MRISDWSSDVCSSDLVRLRVIGGMIRPSQSIYLYIFTRIGRILAENRLVPDRIHLCRFPLYSYRETGYKSKKQRRDFPRLVAEPRSEERRAGKGGVSSVDLGGRRTIKKKKKKKANKA